MQRTSQQSYYSRQMFELRIAVFLDFSSVRNMKQYLKASGGFFWNAIIIFTTEHPMWNCNCKSISHQCFKKKKRKKERKKERKGKINRLPHMPQNNARPSRHRATI
jgi:hypothetical protein